MDRYPQTYGARHMEEAKGVTAENCAEETTDGTKDGDTSSLRNGVSPDITSALVDTEDGTLEQAKSADQAVTVDPTTTAKDDAKADENEKGYFDRSLGPGGVFPETGRRYWGGPFYDRLEEANRDIDEVCVFVCC
jgi:hypothetical protein